MSSPGSVSHWIAALKGGDPAAAQPLRERYYRRLVALARKKLQSTRRAADEEDVVQNAFHSFFRAVAQDAERGRRRGKGGAERVPCSNEMNRNLRTEYATVRKRLSWRV